MVEICCQNCRKPYPAEGVPYRCANCRGVFDINGPLLFDPRRVENGAPGIWRFRHSFGLKRDAPQITLGEGNTPLVWTDTYNRRIGFKLECLNPTGSFKDRGTAVLVSHLLSRGVERAVEDSSGNAGASLAAYAARAGLAVKIFVPDSASGPKRAQIEAYGAEVLRILGPRSESSRAVGRAAEEGATYASHVYLPFGLPGMATLAYELVDQLGEAPGTVVLPVGHGSLFLGLARGFEALRLAGRISSLPRLVAVQALACAPLWAVFMEGGAGLGWVTEGETLAEGVRIKTPLRGDAVLRAVEVSSGAVLVVDEEKILEGQSELARRGFFVEPTSALVWGGLEQLPPDFPDPVIVILTGSGYKSVN